MLMILKQRGVPMEEPVRQERSMPSPQSQQTSLTSQPGDMHPLSAVAGMPAPACWDKHQHIDPLPLMPTPREQQARQRSYVVVACTMTMVMAGRTIPTPLYASYRQTFGFSALTLTLLFATYILTLIPSLLIFGALADAIGRRRVLLIATGAALASCLLLLLAQSTAWLFAARVINGVAVGALSGAGSAALLELGKQAKTSALVATPVALFFVSLTMAQIGLHQLGAQRAAVIGLLLEAIGLGLMLYATALGSVPLLLVAILVGGAGVGLATLGSLSLVSPLIAPQERGDVFGTYYALLFLCLGVAAVAVGVLANPLGLIVAVRWITSIIIMVLCLPTVGALLLRPPGPASGTA